MASPRPVPPFALVRDDLVELLKDALLLLLGDTRSRVRHADTEVTVDRLGSHAHLTGIRKLDGIAHEVEQQLREALLVLRMRLRGPVGRARRDSSRCDCPQPQDACQPHLASAAQQQRRLQ